MKVVNTDIWTYWKLGFYIVIPTNRVVKYNDEAVMGRGLALQTKRLFPDFPLQLGRELKSQGNHVFVFRKYRLITFPVKEYYLDKADLNLICKSSKELLKIIKVMGIEAKEIKLPIYMPKVGCGNGRLNWVDVESIISEVFDEQNKQKEIIVICDLSLGG